MMAPGPREIVQLGQLNGFEANRSRAEIQAPRRPRRVQRAALDLRRRWAELDCRGGP